MSMIEKGFGSPAASRDGADAARTARGRRPPGGGTDGLDNLTFENPYRRQADAPAVYSPGRPARFQPDPPGASRPGRGADAAGERTAAAPLTRLHAVNEAHRPPRADADAELDFARYLRVVRRHQWGITSIILVAVIAGFLFAQSQTPIFRATTTLIAEPFERKISVESEYINNATFFQFYDTQFEIIQSRALAERVVDREKLVERRLRALQAGAAGAAGEPRTSLLARLGLAHWLPGAADDADAPPDPAQLRRRLAAELQGAISVSGGSNSQIIRIAVDHADREQAAALANAVSEAYASYSTQNRAELSQHANRWLDSQLHELKDALTRAEDALLAYRQQHGLVDREQSLADGRAGDLSEMLALARNRSSEARLRWEQVDAVATVEDRRYTASATLMSIPGIQQLAADERVLALKLGELSSQYTDQHPDIARAKSELDEIRKALASEITLAKSQLRRNYELALAQEKEIRELIQQETAEVTQSTASALHLAKLERDVDNHRGLYDAFLTRIQETDMADDYQVSNIRVLDAASVPAQPYKPNKSMIVLIAGLLGAMIGVGLAFLREHLDHTLKSMDDIEDKLGQTALGLVPLVKATRDLNPDLAYQTEPRSPFAEKINHIRTGLMFSSIDDPPRTILITSSTGDEGKTTTAINLAMAFSQLDKTLLIEVDLRKGDIANRLGLDGAQGLTDLLAHPQIGREAIRQLQDNPNFHVLPGGARPPNPLEILSSQQFQNVLDRLREHFRYIVLDGPPLLAVSDAAVVGQQVDMTLLVAQAEKTSLKTIRDATAILRNARIQPGGVVLTKANTRRMAYYGGHHYKYDAHYYGKSAVD